MTAVWVTAEVLIRSAIAPEMRSEFPFDHRPNPRLLELLRHGLASKHRGCETLQPHLPALGMCSSKSRGHQDRQSRKTHEHIEHEPHARGYRWHRWNPAHE